ncbi:MAG: LamB/YcsF family protein [Rhodobacteraceae bacterium]|jgi:UPF0271 protein|nr:LamB/YcsF family protein [Paracoccaceae bacterium]
MKTLDINCDMGESFGNWNMGDDANVMRKITTANVACGFHAGDPVTMMNTIAMANENNVAVGAHPGLPDLLGFGRRVMTISQDDAYAYVAYQVGALQAFLRAQGMKLNHVKPHGAMFHLMRDAENSKAALDAILDVAPDAAFYWPGPMGREPITAAAAERGMTVIPEAYPDLDYTQDGSLIVERKKKWVDPSLIYDRVCQILQHKELTTEAGNAVPMDVPSVCIHGDGPNALDILDAVRRAATDSGFTIACAVR